MIIGIFLVVFLLFRLPSLFEPYWYGDEAVYQVIGTALHQGRSLYVEIWDNKPPPLYLIYALFNGDQFSIRVLSVILGAICIIIFYKISQIVFSKSGAQFIPTLVFTILLALPIFEANIANTEIFMLPLILAAVYLLLTDKNSRHLFTVGILLSLAVLFKQVAIFELIGFSLYLISQKRWQNLQNYLLGILVPGLLVFFYLLVNRILLEFFSSVFSQNSQYVAGNLFGIPYMLPLLKLFSASVATYLVLKYRQLLSKIQFFFLLWFIWSLMDILFTGMNFPHYLLLFSPVLALCIGFLFETPKYKLQILFILLLLIFWLNSYFYIYRDVKGYYTNFVGYIMGNIALDTYRQYFDPRVTRDYKIAQYLQDQETKNVFIWGDNPQIYKLAGLLPPTRYPVVYHLRRNSATLSEAKNILAVNPPKIIIILEGMPPYPFSLEGYDYVTTIDLAKIYQQNNK